MRSRSVVDSSPTGRLVNVALAHKCEIAAIQTIGDLDDAARGLLGIGIGAISGEPHCYDRNSAK